MAAKNNVIITESGFKCKVDEDALNDMRIFDAVIDLEEGDTMLQLKASKTLLTMLLGEDQKEALYKHLEKLEGRPKIESVGKELSDIFMKLKDRKKK